ncbi:MAG: hypothetical protein P8129_24240 [Anaerolineae bacterium]
MGRGAGTSVGDAPGIGLSPGVVAVATRPSVGCAVGDAVDCDDAGGRDGVGDEAPDPSATTEV